MLYEIKYGLFLFKSGVGVGCNPLLVLLNQSFQYAFQKW